MPPAGDAGWVRTGQHIEDVSTYCKHRRARPSELGDSLQETCLN